GITTALEIDNMRLREQFLQLLSQSEVFMSKPLPKCRARSNQARPFAEIFLVACVFLLLSSSSATPIMSPPSWTVDSLHMERHGGQTAMLFERHPIGLVASAEIYPESTHRLMATSRNDATAGCSATILAPEPTSFVLVGTGLLTLSGILRRRL